MFIESTRIEIVEARGGQTSVALNSTCEMYNSMGVRAGEHITLAADGLGRGALDRMSDTVCEDDRELRLMDGYSNHDSRLG